MRKDVGLILSNECIAFDTYKMVVRSNLGKEMHPGQFVNILIDGYSLRRPISIASYEEDSYELIYKVVGDGTKALKTFKAGRPLDVIGPLGNPFPIHDDVQEILVLGGGVGVPPLYSLAKAYRSLDKNVIVLLGFNDTASIFYEEEFIALGCRVLIATMDGSTGTKGTVLDALDVHFGCEKDDFLVYACGPSPMLKAIEHRFTKGYVSYEARMACGIGACMGCICHDKAEADKTYRICKDGPVFAIGKVA